MTISTCQFQVTGYTSAAWSEFSASRWAVSRTSPRPDGSSQVYTKNWPTRQHLCISGASQAQSFPGCWLLHCGTKCTLCTWDWWHAKLTDASGNHHYLAFAVGQDFYILNKFTLNHTLWNPPVDTLHSSSMPEQPSWLSQLCCGTDLYPESSLLESDGRTYQDPHHSHSRDKV